VQVHATQHLPDRIMSKNCTRTLMRNSFNSALLFVLLTTAAATATEAPTIMPRQDWGAAPPSLPMLSQTPSSIIVHHTGSKMMVKKTLAAKMRGLQRFSQAKEKLADGRTKPAWPDIPYHYYIAADGAIAEGRDVNRVGDTNTAYDPKGAIQIVVEGNFEIEQVTGAQQASLEKLLSWLKTKHAIKLETITTHAAKAQTACPGKNLAEKLPGLLRAME
jgi:hypothetical protein